MAFASHKSISEVATAFQITYTEVEFVQLTPITISEYFRSELAFVLREVDFTNSEFSACENLIYPLLKEVWKDYTGVLMLRGHEPLYHGEILCAVPDYLVTRKSPLGKVVRAAPYVLLVVEAKKDNFEEGWGQCLAAMVAAQKLNKDLAQTVYGIVTNGRGWEFGQLQAVWFTHDPRLFPFQELEQLFAAVNFIFGQCQEQLLGVR
jgi:hypothetical protein